MNNQENPILSLFRNHINKELNQDFLDALDALLFLSPPTKEIMALTFPHKITFGTDDKIHELYQNAQSNKSKSTVTKTKSNPWGIIQDPYDKDELESLRRKMEEKKNNEAYRWNFGDEWNNHESNESYTEQYKLELMKKMSSHLKEANSETNLKTVKYNPAEMLLYKLLENLRRLYAAEKASERESLKDEYSSHHLSKLFNKSGSFSQTSAKQTQPMNNQKKLLDEQKVIYKAFNMIKDLVNLDSAPNWFAKSILGKDAFIKPIELWTYLGIHEHIHQDNQIQHYDILKPYIPNMKITKKFLDLMSQVVHPASQNKLVHAILEHYSASEINQSIIANGTIKNTWLLTCVDYLLHNSKDNNIQELPDAEQYKLITSLIKAKVFDHEIFNKYVGNQNSFISKLVTLGNEKNNNFFSDFISKIHLGEVNTHPKTVHFLLKNSQALDDIPFLSNLMVSSLITEEQKTPFFDLYNLNDIELLKNTATHIANNYKNDASKMEKFLMHGASSQSKEVITHIISLNSIYMPICKSAYLNIRLNETVPSKDNNTEQKSTKRKL